LQEEVRHSKVSLITVEDEAGEDLDDSRDGPSRIQWLGGVRIYIDDEGNFNSKSFLVVRVDVELQVGS
jgi:hypothetical protein